MRPIYETPDTLRDERAVIQSACAHWGCESIKLPMSYRIDFAVLMGGQVEAWAEVKCRGKMYPEMYLSLGKWSAGKELSRATGLPFLLLYSFKDRGVFWRRVDEDSPSFVIGGRTDRNDWQDIEPMAVFSLNTFQPLYSSEDTQQNHQTR